MTRVLPEPAPAMTSSGPPTWLTASLWLGFSPCIWIGRTISWLSLAMVLVTFLVVVLRYAFDAGSIAMQESVTYMHAVLFMLGAAYTLQLNGHVRVDIFYQRFSRRGRAWVDLLGTLVLLIPVCLFILTSSWHYVAESWSIHEGSREAGGLPYVYWLKTLMVMMPVLLLACRAWSGCCATGCSCSGSRRPCLNPQTAPKPEPKLPQAEQQEPPAHG
jgi:TRAP-type mannitol/chloroaromatic compound transport system permease small subunit